MTELNPVPVPEPIQGRADEIDLRQLAHVLWHYRHSIALLAAIGATVGAGASAMSTRFRWQGLFITPGLVVDNYKPFEAAIANEARMRSFLSLTGDSNSAAGRFLLDVIERPKGIQEAIRPAFAFTDSDAKQFGVKAAESAIVGITITLEESSPSEQNPPFALLGEYVRDTKIKLDMERLMNASCLEQSKREMELRNSQLQDEFQISQHRAMAETLRELVQRFPQTTQTENRQVVSLEKGAERFLSPVAQLVAVEIAIADLGLAENMRARDRVGTAIMKSYYCEASDALQQPVLGRGFLKNLESIQKRVIAERDAADSAVEAAVNTLQVQRANWINEYLYGMRFITSPGGSHSRVRKIGLASGVVLGGMLGALLAAILAFGRHWWRRNRDIVLADGNE